MGFTLLKTTVSSAIEVFIKIYETATGGFTLNVTPLTTGATVAKGTPMGYNEDTRVADVVKQAVLYEAALNTTVNYKVKKGHHFKVGEIIGYSVGGAAKAIETITTTNPAYDTVGVGTGNSLGVAIAAGEVLFDAPTAGTDTAALKVEPKGLLLNDVTVGTSEPCSIVVRGTVYARRIPTGVCAAVKSALARVLFSDSK
jgi:hypothetical protein